MKTIRISRRWMFWIFLGLGISTYLVFTDVNATNAQLDPGLVDLSVNPIPATAAVGDVVDMVVMAHPNGNQVSAADIRLAYDPLILTPIIPTTVSPGSGFFLLPFCADDETPPCEATASTQIDHIGFTVGVICSDSDGCSLPDTSGAFELSRVHFVVSGSAGETTEVNLNINEQFSITAAFESDRDATRVRSAARFSVSPCALLFDFLPNGVIDVGDIMQVAGLWNENHGTNNYSGQMDIDMDGDIDIVDIQRTANAWNTSCL